MTPEERGPDEVRATKDYRSLPPRVRLEDTVESVEPDAVPDPQAGRNLEQHRALRDD